MSDEEKKELIKQLYLERGIDIGEEIGEDEFQVIEAYVEVLDGRRKKPNE